MEKSSQPSAGESTTTTSTNNKDHYLKNLNKLSHKISKPPSFHRNPTPPPPPQQDLNPPQQPHQPPVYNINKSDFRDVVQKLTGSPSQKNFTPALKKPQQSSRLQRIRPPPLAQISNRTPPMLNCAAPTIIHSPLPPFPTVHLAAESPVSAYMRYLKNSTTCSPRGKQQPEDTMITSLAVTNNTSQFQIQMPYSPLPIGCFPSPKSPYPLLSPNLFPPLSPTTLPVPSPRWRDL